VNGINRSKEVTNNAIKGEKGGIAYRYSSKHYSTAGKTIDYYLKGLAKL